MILDVFDQLFFESQKWPKTEVFFEIVENIFDFDFGPQVARKPQKSVEGVEMRRGGDRPRTEGVPKMVFGLVGC